MPKKGAKPKAKVPKKQDEEEKVEVCIRHWIDIMYRKMTNIRLISQSTDG